MSTSNTNLEKTTLAALLLMAAATGGARSAEARDQPVHLICFDGPSRGIPATAPSNRARESDGEHTFIWNDLAVTPLDGSDASVTASGNLLLSDGARVAIAMPDATCLAEVSVPWDFECGKTLIVREFDESGLATGLAIEYFDAYEPVCPGDLYLHGSETFERFPNDADWYLAIEQADGGSVQIDLDDRWYVDGPLYVYDDFSGLAGAALGLDAAGEDLSVMTATFGAGGAVEFFDPTAGTTRRIDGAKTMQVRVRDVALDEAVEIMGAMSEIRLEANFVEIASIETRACEAPAPDADLDGDGKVDGSDLAELLVSWGACTGCAADFNHDGTVDGRDFALILAAWTE